VVPADFFFAGSDAEDTVVPMVGDGIAKAPKRADGFAWVFGVVPAVADASVRVKRDTPYDTVMVQGQDAVLPAIGSTATVDIRLELVRMYSPDSVTVTGAGEEREYRVAFEILPYHQMEGRYETTGSMSFTRTGISTGKFTATFYAWGRYLYTPINGGETLVQDLDESFTIVVQDENPTHFWIPAMYSPEDVANTATVQPVENIGICGCCCCKSAPTGDHCPAA
jgi:hypothetical protein